MTTDYISSVLLVTQYSVCPGYNFVTIDETCELDEKITLTPEVFAEIYRAAKACERLAAEEEGILTHFDLGADFDGAKLDIHLYIHASDDMDYHRAVFEPLRKALYTENDYCVADIVRRCYPVTEE